MMANAETKPDSPRFTHGCPTDLLFKVGAAYIRGEAGLEVWLLRWKRFSQVQVEVVAVGLAAFTTHCQQIMCSPT